jgi:hypothetical protein
MINQSRARIKIFKPRLFRAALSMYACLKMIFE